MTYAINRKELSAQPVLVIRRRVKLSEIGSALAEILPSVFKHAQQTGAAIAGQPFTRYRRMGTGAGDHRGRNSGRGVWRQLA